MINFGFRYLFFWGRGGCVGPPHIRSLVTLWNRHAADAEKSKTSLLCGEIFGDQVQSDILKSLSVQQTENGHHRENNSRPRVSEWEVIQESGMKLKALFGSGYTGIKNLGNTCYLSTVMQVLFSIPDFQRMWVCCITAKIYNRYFSSLMSETCKILPSWK